MVSQDELVTYFRNETEFTVDQKSGGPFTSSPSVGTTDDTHEGPWVTIKQTQVLYNKDGLAGNSDDSKSLDSLSKDEAIEDITHFLNS